MLLAQVLPSRKLNARGCTESGARSPAINRRVVDFPVPEPPMIPTVSPRLILMFTPLRIFLFPKDLWTSFSSMRTSLSSVLELGDVSDDVPYDGRRIVSTSCNAVTCQDASRRHSVDRLPFAYTAERIIHCMTASERISPPSQCTRVKASTIQSGNKEILVKSCQHTFRATSSSVCALKGRRLREQLL